MYYRVIPLTMLLFVTTGCEPLPPHWGNVCVKTETRTAMRPTAECGLAFDGSGYTCGTFKLKMVSDTTCVSYKKVCIVDKRWKREPRNCENLGARLGS